MKSGVKLENKDKLTFVLWFNQRAVESRVLTHKLTGV